MGAQINWHCAWALEQTASQSGAHNSSVLNIWFLSSGRSSSPGNLMSLDGLGTDTNFAFSSNNCIPGPCCRYRSRIFVSELVSVNWKLYDSLRRLRVINIRYQAERKGLCKRGYLTVVGGSTPGYFTGRCNATWQRRKMPFDGQ